MPKFRLQTVLDYRQRLEDQAQQALAEAQAHRQRVYQQREAHRGEVERLGTALAQRQREGVTVSDLVLYQTRLDHQKEVLAGLDVLLQEAERTIHQRRQALLMASQDREAMDILKEKDRQQRIREEKERETALLDELGGRERTDHDLS